MKPAEFRSISGNGAEQLVIAHLNSLGYPAGILTGAEADIVAHINGWRSFQVKSRMTRSFRRPGRHHWGDELNSRRRLYEYKVDAIVFCYPKDPFPYYIAIEAVTDPITFAPSAFTKAGRDSSFEELLRRWTRLTPEINNIEFSPEPPPQPQLSLLPDA